MQGTLEDQNPFWQEPQRQYQWWSEIHESLLPAAKLKKISNPIQPCSSCEIHEGRKCCNFFPQFANWMVGAILENSSQTAKDQMLHLIDSKQGVTPFGVHPTDNWKKTKKPTCPFLKNGQCSTWQNRPGECASFFCRGTRGNAQLLFNVETAVAQWALLQTGYDQKEIEKMLLSWNNQDNKAQQMWAHWQNNQTEFYLKAWKVAKSLTADHEVIKEVLCS